MHINPFIADDSGRIPPYIAGRSTELDNIKRISTVDEDFRKKNYIVTGLRGVGKSVLLNKLKTDLENNQWISLVVIVFENKGRRTKDLLTFILENLQIVMQEKVSREQNYNEIFYQIIRETIGSIETKATKVIEFCIKEIQNKGFKGLMIGFDEAQFIVDNKAIEEYPRSTLLSLVQNIQAHGLPFFFAFAGLPTLLPSLQESKPNIERAFGFYEKLDHLNLQEAEELIAKTLESSTSNLTFSNDLISKIAELSSGYPYFIQYISSRLIDEYIHIQSKKTEFTLLDLEACQSKIIKELDTKFYDSRFETLSESDRKYFEITLELEKPFLPKDLLQKYNEKNPEDAKSQVAIRQAIFRLVQKGLLLKKASGYDYTIPLIDQYINRKSSEKPRELF